MTAELMKYGFVEHRSNKSLVKYWIPCLLL